MSAARAQEFVEALRATRASLEGDQDIDVEACAALIAEVNALAPSLAPEWVACLRDEVGLLEEASLDCMERIQGRLEELHHQRKAVKGFAQLRSHHKAQKLNRRA